MIHPEYFQQKRLQEELLCKPNSINTQYHNGIFERWNNPVLTAGHVPIEWQYDLDEKTNPYFMKRLGINAVFNAGAIQRDGSIYLVARVEGWDRKSFFAIAKSETGVDQFRFVGEPILLPDTCPEETNVYDMRLTEHEDGWIYGVFCSESKDSSQSDLSAAVAAAGIVRTKDLIHWERLPNLVTLRSPQQRNVVLHPAFVNGKYAFFTRPMDGFIDTGSGSGIGFACAMTFCILRSTKKSSPAAGGIIPLRKQRTERALRPSARTGDGFISPMGSAIPRQGYDMFYTRLPRNWNDPGLLLHSPAGIFWHRKARNALVM